MTLRSSWSAVALIAVLAIGGAAVIDHGSASATTTAATTTSSTSSTEAVSDTTSSSDEAPTVLSADALDAIETDARFAVAALDESTGETLTHGDTGTFDTASIVKVDILAALLEQQGGGLTDSQVALATAMIQNSDNAAATALFEQVGGVEGLTSYNDSIGLTGTTIASAWGLTQTTAVDQLVVLQQALEHGVVEDLMGGVIDSQHFGVSAAADDPDEALLKVGFLQRSATGLWDVTSIGEIERGGHTYLVAVLSADNASYDAGVDLVEQVAQAAFDGSTAI